MGAGLELEHWAYAMSSRDEPYVVREGKKLAISNYAAAKVSEAMYRVESGTARPSEISKVRGDIYELKINQDKRWYRLLFARAGDTYLALLLGAKKTNQLDKGWIETAQQRLDEYRLASP